MPGDCVPSVLTFQSGYISGYLVVAAAATLHLQMTFAETEELRLWLRTQGWPTEASCSRAVQARHCSTLAVAASFGR